MCKLPKGKSDYKELIENGYVYIDKTKYIEMLENSNDSYVHFLRPRRFGKSLFTSMLGYYYDLNEEGNFDALFKDTYIHTHPTKEKNSYYVLNFNFSGFRGKEGRELESEFDDKVQQGIENCIDKYKFPVKVKENTSAARMLSNFISEMQHKEREGNFYVIIDEYDHFANDLLSFHFNEFKEVMSSDGYVRAFYEELKNGTQMGIGRIFVTGVSPISLDSMTSGYTLCANGCNISSNLSLDERYNEMMGLALPAGGCTSEEVKNLISMVDNIENQEKTLVDMKQYYDGYRFSKRAVHHVFNPNMTLYYLDSMQTTGNEPEELVDRNIFSDYSKLEQLLYINSKEDHTQSVQLILDGEHPDVVITQQFTLNKEFSDHDFFSLLFYLGYLTLDKTGDFELTMKIPNMVMKKVFINYFQHMIEKELDFKGDIRGWRKAIIAFLTKNDASVYIQQIESILHKYPDRMYQNFKERNIQQIGEMIVGAINGVDSDLEVVSDEGYCDHVIIPTSSKYNRKLIEYKYLKKEYTDKELEKAISEAKKQIERYSSSRQLQRYSYDAWIMVFAKDTCVYKEAVNMVQ